MNDERLIREYCVAQNQEAFAELARRYAGLVYGTALRHVRDPFVAEEICQKAFVALATRIGSIRNPSQLPAWLYQTTRRLAAMHVRSDQRRVARERVAASMIPNEPATDTSWESIEPLLNEGLDKLGEKDRTALLLRFFRGMPMSEVAEGLGTSEAAAKMRVGRAVEKLRTFFSQHGIACSGAVLLLLLQNNASAQPPAAVLSSVLNQIAHSRNALPPASKDFTSGLRLRLAISGMLGLAVMVLVVVGSERFWRNAKPAGTSQTEVASATPVSVAVPDQNPVKTMPAPALLRLTVLDEKTSTPLFGVRVIALNLGQSLGEAVTDLEGHCELPRPPSTDGDFYYKLRAQCQGYASMNASWSRFQHDNPADIPDSYELKMPQGIRIGGLVADEEGNPVPGIQLKIQSYVTRGGPPPRTRPLLHEGSSEITATDGEGKWMFDRLPPLWENVRFGVSHKAFLPVEYACDATDLPRLGQVTISKMDLLGMRARIVLRRGPLIVGRVVDQSEKAISGVRVVQNFDWADDYATSTTGNNGFYRILNAPTGMLTLSFQADHYSPQTVSFSIDGPTTAPAVVLAPGHILRGRVVDAGGNPVDGVSVNLSRAGKSQEFQFHTTTDATGLFSWDGAPANPVNLSFQMRGFQPTNAILLVDGTEQTVTLEHRDDSGSQVYGQVLDDQTGQPVAAFKFYIYNGQGDEVAPKEGTNGKFSAWLERQPGPAKIEIQAEGYEQATSDPIPLTNKEQTVMFRLRASQGFDGIILTPEGNPVAGAEVVLAADQKGAILGRRKLLFREQTLYRVSDNEGRFHFAPVKDAKLIIAVHQSGYGEKDVQKLSRDPNIRLKPWGRIEGTLRSAGKALPEAKVCLSKRFWNPWTQPVTLYADPFIIVTDSNGRFIFEDVPPGDHALGHLFPGGMFETRATLRVNPGETTHIDLGGSGHPVTGKIRTQKVQAGFDFSHSYGVLKIVRAKPADLSNLARRKDFITDAAYEQAEKLDGARRTAYWNSAEGLAAWRGALSYTVWFDEDGTFHADDVPAGEYDFNVILKVPATTEGRRELSRPVGFLKTRVIAPDSSAAKTDEPTDLGTVELQDRWP
jgi:RNA polymerase sigma factor (sigma-70 family)